MTEIILKKEIDDDKLKTLLDFLKSWGVDAEVRKQKKVTNVLQEDDTFFSVGIWQENDKRHVKQARDFFSNLSLDMSDFSFDRNEANER